MAIDNIGELKNEEVLLETEKIADDLYEIELPNNINTKEVNKIEKVDLVNKKNETIEVIAKDNKIQLSKEQLKNYEISLKVDYKKVTKEIERDGKTETIVLYNKKLKHDENQKDKAIELKGNLPEDAELTVKETQQDRVENIFEDIKIDVAYNIEITNQENTEINPQDFEEVCVVSIADSKISKNSVVYHVKDDDTFEKVNVIESIDGKVTFEAKAFSDYAVANLSVNEPIGQVAEEDITPPIPGTMTMKLNDASGEGYNNNTWTNQNVYISVNNGSDLGGSGHASTTYTVLKGGATYLSDQTEAKILTDEGTYTITVTTTDGAGNTATNTYTVKIDKTNPTVGTLTMKLNASNGDDYTSDTWTNQNVYIAVNNGTDAGGSEHQSTTYTVLKDGVAYSSNQTSETLTNEGTYTITVTTRDGAGNTATSGECKVKIDKTAPTVGTLTMKTPDENGEDYRSGDLVFENVYLAVADGSDALSGHQLTTYTILKNGEAYLGNQTEPQIITEEGTYSITTKTKDAAGNITISETYVVSKGSIPTEITQIVLENGTINPIYRPRWSHSSTIDTTNKKLTITLKTSAYLSQTIDSNVTINYASDVTSTLESEDIQVFVNDVEVTSITNPRRVLSSGVESTNETSEKKEISHTFELSNLEEAARQAGIPYKELSGNIKLKIKGRGKDIPSYFEEVTTDEYGNQNMMETDQNGTNADGTWIAITFEDDEADANEDGTMFADFIKPEFTYEYSVTDIDYGAKTVTIVFSVVDKYFNSSNLTAEQLTVWIDGKIPGDTNKNGVIDGTETYAITRTLTIKTLDTNEINATTGEIYKTDGSIEYNGAIIGKRYELVLSDLEQKDENNYPDGFDFSGTVAVLIPAGTVDENGNLVNGVIDNSGNLNDAMTINVGVDKPENSGTPEIADVVDPAWKMENIDIQTNGVTFDLIATDKYYASNNFTEGMASNLIANDKMLIYVDGILDGDANGNGQLDEGETPTIVKKLTATQYQQYDGESTYTTATESTANAVRYSITLSNWNAEEHSGTTKIVIPEETITDQYENTSVEQEFFIGHIDYVKPVIEKVSSTNGPDGKNQTIVFTAKDKFIDTSDMITIPDETNPDAADEIIVYIDDEIATGITRTLTTTAKIVRNKTTGAVTNQALDYAVGDTEAVMGYEYKLVLSDLEQAKTEINRDREFTDWSGTVEIEIVEGAVKDIRVTNLNGDNAGGNVNDETTLDGNFVDYIKPNVTYEFLESDIVQNHADKTQRKFTMVFDVTDKYFTESAFANALSAEGIIEEQKLEVLQQYLSIFVDTVDITEIDTVTKKIVAVENVEATMNKTIFNNDGTSQIVTGGTYVIGKRFTLEISNLEQAAETAMENDYLDYSGVITVKIKESSATDYSSNVNDATTITSGIDMIGGNPDTTDEDEVVDLVDPIWELAARAEARSHDKYAKLTIKGTDKYIVTDDLIPSDIAITVTSPSGRLELDATENDSEKIYTTEDINGNGTLDEGEDINGNGTIDTGTNLQIRGDVNGNGIFDSGEQGIMINITEDTSVTLDYGKQYKVEVIGFTSDAYQVKLTLRDGILVDESGNTSQETSYVLFSSLVETSTETIQTSEFLSKNKQEGQTIPQRQYVEQVIFKDNLTGMNDTKWDVSQLNDGTIWAWYTTRTADDGTILYTVCIGSYVIINANVNSSYLFANIGYNSNCKVTGNTTDNQMIENLNFIHTASATNMNSMFEGCGYANMQSLDLGSNFDTRLVTTMQSMFKNCGYTSMKTLNIGQKFNTSNVIDMTGMFNSCGYTAMEELHLGNNFDTSKVTNMSQMFYYCGNKLMTSLNLGEKFDTSKVTNMDSMFGACGEYSMTSLNLGNKFDTRNVISMNSMFNLCGRVSMTSLDLGDKFYTTSATNMQSMFQECGSNAMIVLDLGPAFTRIVETNTNFIKEAGKSGELTIYAPESIYENITTFKLNTSSESTISLDVTDDTTTPVTYRGTINPIYKPEWSKVSSSLNTGTGEMTVVVNGSANKVGTPVTQINYLSDVTSTLTSSGVTVYIDGELAEGIDTSDITVSTATTSTNETTDKAEVQHTIKIANFEQALRIGGKNFKEWSGNVELQFAKGSLLDSYGSYIGEDAEGNALPVVNVSKDADGNIVGNSSLAVIHVDTVGTTENIVVEETTKLTANTETTEANMFTDLIKPEFTYEYANTVIDYAKNKKSVTVVFDVTDKYFNSTDLASDNNAELIEVLVDGVLPGDEDGRGTIDGEETLAITKTLVKSGIFVINTETHEISSKATDYTLQTNERKVGERYQLVISNLQQNPNDSFDFSGIVTLGFDAGIVDDLSGNENAATSITIGKDDVDGNPGQDTAGDGTVVDVVDPIWRVQNLSTTTTNGITTTTMDLIATDKFFKETDIEANDIEINVAGVNIAEVDAEGNQIIAPELQRTLSEPVYILWDNETGTYTTDGITQENANGQKYTFTISNLEETYEAFIAERAKYIADDTTGRLYREYSGPVEIVISAGTITDESNNENIDFTIDGIGHVDTLKPEVVKVSSQANVNATNPELSTHTIVFDIVDKYINSASITETDTSMIHVYFDGEEAPSMTKPATEEEQKANSDKVFKEITSIQNLTATVKGTPRTIGYRYTLVLSGIENPRTSINYDREYTDWSGDLSIKIDANTARDTKNNANDATILYGNEGETKDKTKADHVDYVKPDATYEYDSVQEGVSDVTDKDGKTYTMVFDVTDKFFLTEDINANGQLDEGEDTNSNGILDDGDTLSIGDFSILMSAEEETGEGEDGYYNLMTNAKIGKALDSVDITNAVVVDVNADGTEVKETRVIGKRYTLRLSNLEQLQRIENNYYLDYSGSITITIPANKIADTSGNGNDVTTITTGIDIPGGDVANLEMIDVTQPLWERTAFTTDIHANTATITLLGTDKYFYEYDLEPGDEGYDADLANKGTLTLEEIDLYINGIETTETISEGVKTLTDAEGNVIGKLSINSETKLYEERIVQNEYSDGDVDTGYTTEDVQYGVQYVLNITDLAITAEQIKIHLPEGSLVDQSGNKNRVTEFLVYNTLRKAQDDEGNWEEQPDRGFLGNANILRINIENVEFVDSLDSAPTIDGTTCWDVSAVKDNSILAWATQTETQAINGLYTVYIGSNDDIYGNIDSSYLFAYIGANELITATDTISGISLLDTRNVTNMTGMFLGTGAIAMTELDLGANFDTSNVTNMSNMFGLTGTGAMTSLDLGEKFDTENVTDMSNMFGGTGTYSLTSLDFGNKFDTSSVQNMNGMFSEFAMESTGFTTLNLGATGVTFDTSSVTDMTEMFSGCGQAGITTFSLGSNFNTEKVTDMNSMFEGFAYNLETLDLGAKFDTRKVIDMTEMFSGCGQTAMKTLKLGDKFDTSSVTNMSNMFSELAKNSTTMTSLDLGDKFYTTSATDMSNMFSGCGQTSMTTLDLGPAFTKIADTNTNFVTNCGKSGAITIYAPESIYKDMHNFKLSTESTTTITLDVTDNTTTPVTYRGTINPIYRPEWSKVSSTLNTSTGVMSVVVKGSANKTFTNGTYTGTYVSDVASTLATEKVTVYVDDELADDITVTVGTANESTNATTNAVEIQQTITFNLEKTLRRTGKNFLEWSGNISLQFAKGSLRDKYGSYLTTETQTDAEGNSVDVTVPVTNVFTDTAGNYIGNSNLAEIDTGTTTDGDGNTVLVMEKIVVADTNSPLTENTEEPATEANMFSDTIEPEFTYEYYNTETDTGANTVIDYVNNKITVVFDVTDKYFKEAKLTKEDITVAVAEDANVDTAIEKQLTKTGIFVMNKETKEITLQLANYTIDETTEQKTGERYQLVVTGLESENGVGYSGTMTLTFPEGQTEVDENGDTVLAKGMIDNTGNLNPATTITIGIDKPNNHPEHNTGVIVDVVNPLWVGLRDVNSIERTDTNSDTIDDDTVSIKILGIDKYYKTNTLSTDDITVYIDIDGNGTIEDTEILELDPETDMTLEAIPTEELVVLTEDNELARYDDVSIGYTLKLTGFGNYSGITKIKIDDGTIEDQSGNKNVNTDPIFAGNTIWVETNEPLEDGNEGYPRYPAFRNDIVDFIDPVITYTYSTVKADTDGDGDIDEDDSEVSANPDIDYETKQVTVKFTVTDKYFLESDLIKTTTDAEGNEVQIPKNINILVDEEKIYDSSLETQTTQVTTSISATDITGGKEYTLVVSNIQQQQDELTNTTPENGNGINFSGPMQLVFAAGAIEDTSGNTNKATTISLDTHVEDDVVDVVDPIIKYVSSTIDRTYNTVTVTLRAEDKYYESETFSTAEDSVKVKVVDEYGNEIVNDTTTITKDISKMTTQSQYVIYTVQLSNFTIYEGKTSIIIPADVIKDTSGNGNVETEILVGSPDNSTAFKDSIVDFTKPTWEYVTSSINRDVDENGVRTETGTVTLEVKGTDIYFDKAKYFDDSAYQLNLSQVKVYVNGVEDTLITKTFATNEDGSIKKEYIEETKELATDYDRVLKGVKYTLILGNFRTNEGTVRVDIPIDAIKDTSTNGNIVTPIEVGNPEWIETVGLFTADGEVETENPDSPIYTAFRNDIVDYIKPVIKYQYEENVNPVLDTEHEEVKIKFTSTDINYLSLDTLATNMITLEDIKIYIDNMQVYGTGANEATDITADLDYEIIEGTPSGIEYTLTLSVLELNALLENEIFERHSGVIKLVIASDQVADTSGNKNIETTLIIDNDDGDDEANGIIVDFINPIIYYHDKYVNWEDRYALITVRATDRFYDTTTKLDPSDIKLYEKNADGNYIEITSITQEDITITPVANAYGYDFVIRLDNFEEEFEMKISIPANQIADTSDNWNDATDILVSLDNKRPVWNYVSTDTSNFESSGTISFTVKGQDKFLDLTNSSLDVADIKVLKDGVDITNADNITVNYLGTNTAEEADEDIFKKYQIDVTGLTEMGTYSLVFAKDTLVDTFNNKSAATTISFSNAVIASNTGNYVNVTYHVSADLETVHKSYVHELMSVNTTGTNFENTTYRPSSLGELFNNGENPLFAEPIYVPQVSGYTVSKVYSPKSFAGWAESDENGNVIYYTDANLTTVSNVETSYTRIFGLYDEIPNTVTHLKALWQDAKIVYVSAVNGDNTNNGELPATSVKDLATAYNLLDTNGDGTPDGTAESNIIIIMDAVEYNSLDTLIGNATITSIYGGIDYRAQGAELKVSSAQMIVNGDTIFDNIELYGDATLVSNYSGDITIGRGITTPAGKYTFATIVGGNYQTETSTGELGTHTIRIEAGKYTSIYAGSSLTTSTETTKSVTHNLIIGNMRDTAVSRNDKLIINTSVMVGKNEQKCYPSGADTANEAADKAYANVTIYSGTIGATGNTDPAIYLRSLAGSTDGLMNFEMYGGQVVGDIYGGSRVSTLYATAVYNTMKFYGGQVTGNIYGQGVDQTFFGSLEITLQGNFSMTGNVFGGPNMTSATNSNLGEGDSTIIVNSASTTINGNIYGGGRIAAASTGYVTGNTNITINSGTVQNIYGSGFNCGNTGISNITIENGVVNQNIYGGAYQNQVRTSSNISVLGGTVHGNIYGGNENTSQEAHDNDSYSQDVNIIIGDTDATKKPNVKGTVYGSGKYDKVDAVTIELYENEDIISVFGGSDEIATTATTNIYLKGMTVNEIYGGSHSKGTVGTSNIYLQSGTVTDVYGGGYGTDVTTKANVTLEGTATATTIYGGSNSAGTVTTSSVVLKSGNVTNVFGGGNSAEVGTANVTLDGVTLNTIHGGSKDAGVVTKSNVTLTSGTVTNVFGGGLDVGATTSNIKQQGATVTNIYGGNNTVGTESATGGETGTANIDIQNSTVANVYGGNYLKGTTNTVNINIHGTANVTGNVFGGGYKSNIGKTDETGSITINIAGGTINGDINGGSEEGIVYGNVNIFVGNEAIQNSVLIPKPINIIGTIYGAGSTQTVGENTVIGYTNITMDNNTSYPITYFTASGKEKSIYGSGKGEAKYLGTTTDAYGNVQDKSTIHLLDFGTSTSPYLFKSIENTGDLYIGNSTIEISGALEDTTNAVGHYYTLNTITNALTIYNNTTLYTQRGFNKVGGFYSYVNQKSTKATVTISDGVATTNVNNKLYTLEGVNLIFAKKNVTLANKATLTQDDWGEVTGMAYFGTYKNTLTGKQYDLELFRAGTYVEGLYHSSTHNIERDGFYTTLENPTSGAEEAQIITTVNYTNYCDWIINAPTINYELDLVASTYGENSVAELLLNYVYETDYTYKAETVYTLNQVSSNALKPDVELVDPADPTKLPTISSNANNKFGLTMETTDTGWQQQAFTKIYSASNGSFGGDSVYTSDTQSTPGSIKFKVHNSLNITEEKDLGLVTIKLIGQQPISEEGAEAYTFNVVIAVNLQTIVNELSDDYVPSFTDRTETELSYTTDSRVDLSYLLYNNREETHYITGDYRVLSTTLPLPKGTELTMRDYGEGDSVNKIYYYQVASDTDYDSTETVDGTTRYIYKLSKFAEMGSTNDSYLDTTNYYHSANKYVLEKYDISIDFIDANVDNKVSADILALAQETYIELRDSSGNVKYDNGETTIEYNLCSGKNAIATTDISNEGSSYSVVESIEIPIDISGSLLQQPGVLDTKYHDQIAGIAVQIVGENNMRIKSPELQNFKLTNKVTGEIYEADSNGTIRVPIIAGLGTKSSSYTLSVTQSNVSPGLYRAQVLLYTADDGLYYGDTAETEPLEFNITFISRLAGLLGAEAKDLNELTRIINKTTGLSLVEGSASANAIDLVLGINNPTNETNIRVELYKRNATYTSLTDETSYTGTSYTLVDIKNYLQGTWTEAVAGSKEYMVSNKKTYETEVQLETIDFQKAIIQGISTGEYKLVFKAYSDDTLIQTFSKTFIITE